MKRWLGRVLTAGVVIALILFAVSELRPAVRLAVSPQRLARVGSVSDRFLSYNIEMVEVTGGRFWRPYDDARVQSGADRYEYRPPLDLTNPRLRKLAGALGPAYVRFSGTWANATYFLGDAPASDKPPAGFDSVLTGLEWRHAVDFARVADAGIVTSFATSPGTRNAQGRWGVDNAEKLLRYTRSLGANIAAAEFANEPNMIKLTQPPPGYTAADYRRDYEAFHTWIKAASPRTWVLAPGVAELGEPIRTVTRHFSGMKILEADELLPQGSAGPDAVSFHYYGGASQRCNVPLLGTKERNAVSESWLSGIDKPVHALGELRDRYAPGKPLWITESGESACGGNPWAKTFIDSFRFTDQLARTARQGVQVFMHNTLSASDYGLLDEKTFLPRPDYWAALLWRTLMGTIVLDAGAGAPGRLHVYAHCLRDSPGGVVVLAINLQQNKSPTLELDAGGELFALTQGPGGPGQVALNGSPLKLGPDDALPTLQGVHVTPGELHLAPASINFLVFESVQNGACGRQARAPQGRRPSTGS